MGTWKTLSAAVKAPYEKKAADQKAEYHKFLETDEGKKALSEKKEAKAEAKADKSSRACKAALKAVEKDDALKRPQTAYWMWLEANRERIGKEIGSKAPPALAKQAGQEWAALTEAKKAPYEAKAKAAKEKHDEYLNSAEGQEKLKAFKEAQKAAKDQFKPPSPKKEGARVLSLQQKRA